MDRVLTLLRFSPSATFGVRLIRAGLLAYGLLMGSVAADQYARGIPDRGTMMSMRSDAVSGSIRVLDSGGPPLVVASCVGYDYCELPSSDSPGIYLYLPLLGHLFHTQSAELLLKWFFIGLMAPVVGIYPLLVFRLLGSVLAAIAAPWLLLAGFSFLRDSEIYWALAWAVLLGVPLLTIAWRSPPRVMMLMLIAVMVLASFASSIRFFAGFPLLISAIGIVLLRERSWLRRGAFAVALLLAYLAIEPGLFAAVMAIRDRSIAGASVAPGLTTTLWHQFYLGLSYLDNPYGIRYEDGVAYEAVKSVDPSIRYLGPGYGDVLRGLFIKIVVSDPRFFTDTIVAKAVVVVGTAIYSFGLALLLVPFAVRARERGSVVRASLLFALPAALYGVISPVLVMPFVTYQMTWLGACGYAAVLCSAWAISGLPRGLDALAQTWREDRWGAHIRTALRSRALRAAVFLLPVVAVVSGALVDNLERTQELTYFRLNQAPTAAVEPGARVNDWRMVAATDAGWRLLPGVVAAPSAGVLEVTTNATQLDYQLVGPNVSLDSGRYRVLVDGEIAKGGMNVGVLDNTAASWIVQALYWSGQFERDAHVMIADFTLKQPAEVGVVLSNWRLRASRSEWLLRRISIERLTSQ